MSNNLPKALVKELIKYQSRQGRKKADFFLVEGERCCREALKWSSDIRYAVHSEGRSLSEVIDCSFPIYCVNEQDFARFSLTENAQGIFYVIGRPSSTSLKLEDPFLLVLDGLQEPGNMGTILRTALATGIKEVAITRGTVDPYNPKAIRSGMGAQFQMSIQVCEDLVSLVKANNFDSSRIWLTSPHDGVSCYDSEFVLDGGVLVFGEEGGGIKDFAVGRKTMIPMPGDVESLNVAQAATIYLFEAVRRSFQQ